MPSTYHEQEMHYQKPLGQRDQHFQPSIFSQSHQPLDQRDYRQPNSLTQYNKTFAQRELSQLSLVSQYQVASAQKENAQPTSLAQQPFEGQFYTDSSMPKCIPLQFTDYKFTNPLSYHLVHKGATYPDTVFGKFHQNHEKETYSKKLEGREIVSPDNTQVINRNLSHDKEHNKVLVNSDIVLIMDSNGRKLDPKLLYPVEGSTSGKLYCPLLEDVEDLFKGCTFQKSSTVVLIHCGTNNLNKASPKWVTDKLASIACNLSNKLRSSKIILSDLLPRGDFQNNDIYQMNLDLSKNVQLLPNIHFALRQNLLSEESKTFLLDKKHLNDTGVKLFSRNMKDSIFGRSTRSRTRKNSPARKRRYSPSLSRYDFPS